MSQNAILGIDPGAHGGITLLNASGAVLSSAKMPETPHDIAQLIGRMVQIVGIRMAYLEAVHSMPNDGKVQAFAFAKNVGILIGVLAALNVPYRELQPRAWQAAMGIPVKGAKTDSQHKNLMRARAQQLFPAENIILAKSDSILIAEYGRRLWCAQNNLEAVK